MNLSKHCSLAVMVGVVILSGCSHAPVASESELNNLIAKCTGGLRLSQTASATLNAAIEEEKKSGNVTLSTGFHKSVEGAILMDEKADSATKQLYITKYHECISKN